MLGLLAVVAGITLTVRTKHGEVVIALNDPTAKVDVTVDGERIELTGLDKPLTLTVGEHGLAVNGPDFDTVTRSFTVKRGEKQVVKVTLKPKALAARAESTPKKLTPAPAADGFISLFNGKDLTGWKVYPDGTGKWKVEDGVLVGRGPASHLFSERGDYKNFHFRVEAKINDKGNSGQYFRTKFGPRLPQRLRGADQRHARRPGQDRQPVSRRPADGSARRSRRSQVLTRRRTSPTSGSRRR